VDAQNLKQILEDETSLDFATFLRLEFFAKSYSTMPK